MVTFFVSWGEGPKLRKLEFGIFNGGGRFLFEVDDLGKFGDTLFWSILIDVALVEEDVSYELKFVSPLPGDTSEEMVAEAGISTTTASIFIADCTVDLFRTKVQGSVGLVL